jgi:hypothetical protein
MNYPRLIIAIATFYVLPVIQLVLMYQTVSNNIHSSNNTLIFHA